MLSSQCSGQTLAAGINAETVQVALKKLTLSQTILIFIKKHFVFTFKSLGLLIGINLKTQRYNKHNQLYFVHTF